MDLIWLIVVMVCQIGFIAAFHFNSKAEDKFSIVLPLGILLRAIFLPPYPYCLVGLGYLAHLVFPVQGLANFVLTLALDATSPQTYAAIVIIPIRFYSAVLGFEKRGSLSKIAPPEADTKDLARREPGVLKLAFESKYKPSSDEVTEFKVNVDTSDITRSHRKHVHETREQRLQRDHIGKETSIFEQWCMVHPPGEKVNVRGIWSCIATTTLCVMLGLRIPWSSNSATLVGSSCPGVEAFGPCNPWQTVSTGTTQDAGQCCQSCNENAECQAWQYKNHENSCWLLQYTNCPNGDCAPCSSYPGQYYGSKSGF